MYKLVQKKYNGFDWTPEEYVKEIARRYDIDNNDYLTLEEAKEWVFCLAPFFDELDTNPAKFDQGRFRKVTSPTLSMCEGRTPTDEKPKDLDEIKIIIKVFIKFLLKIKLLMENRKLFARRDGVNWKCFHYELVGPGLSRSGQ